MFALALIVAFTTAWSPPPKPYRGESDKTKFYVVINERTCEGLGFVDVTQTSDCQDALNSSPDPTFNNKYKKKIRSSKRTKGCVYSHKSEAGYVVTESGTTAPADRAQASGEYKYFCLYDQAASLMASAQHTVSKEGWFCASSKQLPTANSADECMAATLADGQCFWTDSLTKHFYIDGSGLCACGTDACTGRYKSAGRTIYETTDVAPVDCSASGEPDKNECDKNCDWVDNITTKRKGFGGWCDWDNVKEESCEDGDGACVYGEASTLAFADMDATDAGVLFFAMIGAGSLVYGTYQFFVRKTLYSEISESSPLDV